LQSNQSQFNFFLPEQASEPVQNAIDHGEHSKGGVLKTRGPGNLKHLMILRVDKE
jgi:hypothetical protein